MKKLFTVTLVLVLFFLAGCKNPLFNPKADARISYFTDTSNLQISSLTLSGAAPHTVKAFIVIANGVDVSFSKYTVECYTPAGNKIPVIVEGKTSAYIAGTGSVVSAATGYVGLNITSPELVTYKTTNSLSQINLQVLLSGEDINGNQIAINGTFPVY